MKSLLFAAVWACVAAPATASSVFIEPDAAVVADDVTVQLVFLNEEEEAFQVPARLQAEWISEGEAVPVTLAVAEPAVVVEKGAFAKIFYRIANGAALPQPDGAVLRVASPWTAEAHLALSTSEPGTGLKIAEAADAGRSEASTSAPEEGENFSTYEPVYAVLGLEPVNAKLQFSFKYALVDPQSDAAARWSFLRGVYFGYTQTMFWDLAKESSPFRSIDFKPELFYRYARSAEWIPLAGSGLRLQTGLRHQSNGREEPASRSFNEAYVEPAVILPLDHRVTLTFAPRAWLYFGDLEDNPDIADYRGYSSLRFRLEEAGGTLLDTKLTGYLGLDRGSFQADLSHPIGGKVLGNLNLRAHAQLYTGYGDNLFDYNRHATRLRVGLSLFE